MFIVLLWIIMFVWTYYPLRRVSVTKVELQQTELLLEKNNITAPGELLKKKARAIAGARVSYPAADRKAFAGSILGNDAAGSGSNSYTADGTTLTFKESSVVIEGSSPELESLTRDNAAGRTKKLLDSFGLSEGDMSAHVYEKDGGWQITFVPEFKGRSVFDARIKFTVSGADYKIEGVPMKFSGGEDFLLPQSPCSALADLALADTANGAEVTGMTLGYRTKNGLLIPAWEIRTSDGSTYYVE